MSPMLFIATLFVAGADTKSAPDADTSIDRFRAMEMICERSLQHAGKGGEPAYCKYARQLAREKQWETIQKIFASDRFNSFLPEFSREIVSVSSGADAVAFLRTVPKETHAWHLGMLFLSKKHDAIVSAYLKEVVKDKDPRVRATCYIVCSEHRWPDLIREARADTESLERYSPQMGWSFGLADDAKSYRVALGDLPKGTPIEPPRHRRIPSLTPGQPLFPLAKP